MNRIKIENTSFYTPSFTFSAVTFHLLSSKLSAYIPTYLKGLTYGLFQLLNLKTHLNFNFPPDPKLLRPVYPLDNLKSISAIYTLFFLADYYSGADILANESLIKGWNNYLFLKAPLGILLDWLSLTIINFISLKIHTTTERMWSQRFYELKNLIQTQCIITSTKNSRYKKTLNFSFTEAKEINGALNLFLKKHLNKYFPDYEIYCEDDKIEINIKGVLSLFNSNSYQKNFNYFSEAFTHDALRIKTSYSNFNLNLAKLNEFSKINWQSHFSLEGEAVIPRAFFYQKKTLARKNYSHLDYIYYQIESADLIKVFPKLLYDDPILDKAHLYIQKHKFRPIIVALVGKLTFFLCSFIILMVPSAYQIIGVFLAVWAPFFLHLIYKKMDLYLDFFSNAPISDQQIRQWFVAEISSDIVFILPYIFSGKFKIKQIFLILFTAAFQGFFENIFAPYTDTVSPINSNQEKTREKVKDIIAYFFPDDLDQFRTQQNKTTLTLIFKPLIKTNAFENRLLLKIISDTLTNVVNKINAKVENNLLTLVFAQVMNAIVDNNNYTVIAIKKIHEAMRLALKFKKLKLGIENSSWKICYEKVTAFNKTSYLVLIRLSRKYLNYQQSRILKENFTFKCTDDEFCLYELPNTKAYTLTPPKAPLESQKFLEPPTQQLDDTSTESPQIYLNNFASTQAHEYLLLDHKPNKQGDIFSFLDENFDHNNIMDTKISKLINYIEEKRFELKQPSRMLSTQVQGGDRLIIFESIEKIYNYLLPLGYFNNFYSKESQIFKGVKIIKTNSDKTIKLTFKDKTCLNIICLPINQDMRHKLKTKAIMSIPTEFENTDSSNLNYSFGFESKLKSDAATLAFTDKIPDLFEALKKTFKRRTDRDYDFSSGFNQSLFVAFAKFSFEVWKIDSNLSIEIYGGLLRSILMGKTASDLDMRVWFGAQEETPEDFLQKLQDHNIITRYKKMPIPSLVIYNIWLNYIFTSLRFVFHKKNELPNLDFTFNTLSLSIRWTSIEKFKIRLVVPQCAEHFIFDIKNNTPPSLMPIKNIESLKILKLPRIKAIISKTILNISEASPDKVNNFLTSLQISLPKNFNDLKPEEKPLADMILSILHITLDPKRIFRLIFFYDSTDFTLSSWLKSLVEDHISELFYLSLIEYVAENDSNNSRQQYKKFICSTFQHYFYKSLESKTTQPHNKFWQLAKTILMLDVTADTTTLTHINKIFADSVQQIDARTPITDYYFNIIPTIPNVFSSRVIFDIFLIIMTLSQLENFIPRTRIRLRNYTPETDLSLRQSLLDNFTNMLGINARIFNYPIHFKLFGENKGKFDFKPDEISKIIYKKWHTIHDSLWNQHRFNNSSALLPTALTTEPERSHYNKCIIC